MFSLPSVKLSVPSVFKKKAGVAANIPQLPAYDIETSDADKRTRTLKYLLKLNHANHGVWSNKTRSYNTMAHALGACYITGCSAERLEEIYEQNSRHLNSWNPSPSEVTRQDWRDFLGDTRYQRAYVDFFEDELVLNGYDWHRIVDVYLFQQDDSPLFKCILPGHNEPLVQLSYAYELSSRQLAMEALGSIAISYNFFHKFLDEPRHSKPPTWSSYSMLEVLNKAVLDEHLNSYVHDGNIEKLFNQHEEILVEYWNALTLQNLAEQLKESQKIVAMVVLSAHIVTRSSQESPLIKLLTTSHAIRVLLPVVPYENTTSLMRQWWLFMLVTYLGHHKLTIDHKAGYKYNLNGRSWDWVQAKAIQEDNRIDTWTVQAIRTLRIAYETWGDEEDLFLKAAVKLCNETVRDNE